MTDYAYGNYYYNLLAHAQQFGILQVDNVVHASSMSISLYLTWRSYLYTNKKSTYKTTVVDCKLPWAQHSDGMQYPSCLSFSETVPWDISQRTPSLHQRLPTSLHSSHGQLVKQQQQQIDNSSQKFNNNLCHYTVHPLSHLYGNDFCQQATH